MAQSPRVGDAAPEVKARDQDGTVVDLASLRGRWVVLYFYPKDETYGCTREACGFRDLTPDLEREGATVIGVSSDDVASHRAFATHRRLSFPLLADPDGDVARRFGARAWYGRARRITFLIDPSGRIVKRYRVLGAGGHPMRVLEDLRTFKKAEKPAKIDN